MTAQPHPEAGAPSTAPAPAGTAAPGRAPKALPALARALLALALLALFGGLARAVLSLTAPAPGLSALVAAHLEDSGVAHPVTAVLLNFRGYDTLLEVAVLLLALIGTWSIAKARGCDADPPGPLLRELPRLLVPLMVLMAGYLLWVGAYAPGGAFQAGSLLGGVGIMLCLSGRRLPQWTAGLPLRVLAALGVVVFAALGVGAAALPGGAPLGWPPAAAKGLILAIELAATLSIGFILAALFAGGRP